MAEVSENNKRIAKNTILLYIRMLLIMLISLYTSRVVLNTLGVTDYGIYNVVGGVIAMFSFLTNSMGAASSRYITYDLGRGEIETMKRTFGNIVTIHLLLAGIILLLGETVGLWFVLNKLQIPSERINAAIWVYQFSVFTSVLTIISVPYNAAIIAHERMKAFAYIGVVDAGLKLLIVYLLLVIPLDKLVTYAGLLFCIQLFDRVIFGVYCTRHFEETRTKCSFSKELFSEIFGFAFWTMNGNLAVIGYTQGLNILLNIFFGPVVNAARGVAVQVQGVVMNFCRNFQMALNPQLTKSYAQEDLVTMQRLLKLSSKFSFYLLFLLSLPLIFEAPLVLKWWLGIVPEHTVNFLRLILCSSMLVSLSNPLIISVHATGNIKKFQLIEGTMLLCIVPIAYILLKYFKIAPEYVFCVHIIVEACTQYVRMRIVLPMISMRIAVYIRSILIPILKVLVLAPILPLLIYYTIDQSVMSFLLVCGASVLSVIVSIYFVGCEQHERKFFVDKLSFLIKRKSFRS